MLKGRYGSYPGYNIQAGVDATNHMVVSAEVTNHANDWNELSANVESSTQETGSAPQIVLADKGYANISEIESVQNLEGVSPVVVPLQKVNNKRPFESFTFTYDKENDQVTCSKGKMAQKGRLCKSPWKPFSQIYGQKLIVTNAR